MLIETLFQKNGNFIQNGRNSSEWFDSNVINAKG